MQFLFVGSAQEEVASYARTTGFTPGGICIAVNVHYLALKYRCAQVAVGARAGVSRGHEATTVRCDIQIVH